MKEFFAKYLERLKTMINNTDLQSIQRIITVLNTVAKKKKNVWIIGNGGSAATASHLSLNIGNDLFRRGIINIKAQSLTDNTAVLTAACNDIGYENGFALQLDHLSEEGDILIAISCSGNSKNIIKAMEVAHRKDITVIGVSGFSGGELKQKADIVFHVPADKNEYGLVEDVHMILVHMLYTYYIECYRENIPIHDFIEQYKLRLYSLLNDFDIDSAVKVSSILKQIADTPNRIYFLGNGGSAAIASHMVNDFGIGLKRRGILNISTYSLADNSAAMTAAGNDIGYNNSFNIQLKDVIHSGDILFCLSASGNSENILKAVEYAKYQGATILSCTGFSGGRLKELSDISFHVNSKDKEYGLTQDLHMILDHMLYTYFVEMHGETK